MARWVRIAAVSAVLASSAQASCDAEHGCGLDDSEEDESVLLQMSQKSRAAQAARQRASGESCPASAEWIVVGGGAGGCAAAAALADSGQEVLLLERGPSQHDIPSTLNAKGWPASVNDAGQGIRFTDGTWGVVANVLGGGTSLNGGLFFHMPEQWFSEFMPSVNYTEITAFATKVNGELSVPSQPTPFGLAWHQALIDHNFGTCPLDKAKLTVETTHPFVPYSNFHFSEAGGPRTGSAYLVERRSDNPKLRVATDTTVLQVLFDGTEAVGVKLELASGTVCDQVTATKGVVLAAGAIMTPQLLQISGVGPADVLEKLGVKPVVTTDAVGANFVDRLVAVLATLSPIPIEQTIGFTVMADQSRQQLVEGVAGGRIASELAMASIALVPPSYRVELLKEAIHTIFTEAPAEAVDMINQMLQVVNLQMDTKSRGRIEAVSTDVNVPPQVTANYFSDDSGYDLKSQMDRLKELMSIMQSPAMTNYTIHKRPNTSKLLMDLLKTIGRSALGLSSEEGPDALKNGKDEGTASFAECSSKGLGGRRRRHCHRGHRGKLDKKLEALIDKHLQDAMSCVIGKAEGALNSIVTVPCAPDPDDAQALEKYARDNVMSSYHYFGTTALAVDAAAKFAVKGTSKLHIADASVFPVPTIANPQGEIMSLGYYIGKKLSEP